MNSATEPDDPLSSLLDKDPSEMTDDELRSYVEGIRARRTSQQLINENRPARPTAVLSKTKKLDAAVKGLLDL